MFRDQTKKQVIGVVSVSSDDVVVADKVLAETINRTPATSDMKIAKAALAKALQ